MEQEFNEARIETSTDSYVESISIQPKVRTQFVEGAGNVSVQINSVTIGASPKPLRNPSDYPDPTCQYINILNTESIEEHEGKWKIKGSENAFNKRVSSNQAKIDILPDGNLVLEKTADMESQRVTITRGEQGSIEILDLPANPQAAQVLQVGDIIFFGNVKKSAEAKPLEQGVYYMLMDSGRQREIILDNQRTYKSEVPAVFVKVDPEWRGKIMQFSDWNRLSNDERDKLPYRYEENIPDSRGQNYKQRRIIFQINEE